VKGHVSTGQLVQEVAMKISCVVCAATFDAVRSSAKYCSNRCRMQSRRSTGGAPASALVRAVTADLESAGAVDSYAGQLALELARRMSIPGQAGLSSLSRELRVVMAEALGPAAPVPEVIEPDVGGAPEDIVDEVRRKREQRQASAAAAG
jgi:hypothetical protein